MQPYLRATGWVASDYFQALARAECDLAICYWPVGRCDLDIDTSACTYRVIGHERLIPMTGLKADGTPCAQLPGTRQQPVPWLAYPKRGLLGSAVKAHLARLPQSTCLTAQSENLYAAGIKELVLLGYGMSWLPERNVAAELANGTLVRLETAAGMCRWSCGFIVTKANNTPNSIAYGASLPRPDLERMSYMSATLYQQQREHIASLQRAYQQCLANHQLDSLAIYSGHARNHFADDHATSFQSYGHFIHWSVWQTFSIAGW